MKSDAVRIAQENSKAELYRQLGQTLSNPMFGLVAGILLIEYFQSHEETITLVDYNVSPPKYWTEKKRVSGGGWLGEEVGTAAEVALAAAALAPTAIKVAEQVRPLMEAVAPIVAKSA